MFEVVDELESDVALGGLAVPPHLLLDVLHLLLGEQDGVGPDLRLQLSHVLFKFLEAELLFHGPF